MKLKYYKAAYEALCRHVNLCIKDPNERIDLVGYPKDLPKQYNACSDPCDMLFGPCACGAWHFGEHIERMKVKK